MATPHRPTLDTLAVPTATNKRSHSYASDSGQLETIAAADAPVSLETAEAMGNLGHIFDSDPSEPPVDGPKLFRPPRGLLKRASPYL